jgi:hypothetical protein
VSHEAWDLLCDAERRLAEITALRDQLRADYDRPEGRWGIHGHSAVDDDYFAALEYVLTKMDAILRE